LLSPDVGISTQKCTKFNFDWGSAPQPAGGAYRAPQTWWLDLSGRTSKGGGVERKGKARRKHGSALTLIYYKLTTDDNIHQ